MLKTISAYAALLAGAAASPVLAQDSGFDRDSHFDGPYVQIFGGVAAQPSDKEDSIVFDTNGDDDYVDTVSMAMHRFRRGGYVTTNLDEPDDIIYFKSRRQQGYY